jgi:integrase
VPDPDRPRLVRIAGRPGWHIYHRRRRFSAGTSDRAEAERALAAYAAGLGRPALPTAITIADLLERHLADAEAAKKPRAERLRWAHKAIGRHLGMMLPEAIDRPVCRSYAVSRADEGAATGTVRTELQALTAALRWALEHKMLAEMPKLELAPASPRRERWLTRPEAAKLLEAARTPHVRLFIALALHTAARRGAILGLTWDRVDLERRRIDLRDAELARSTKGRAIVPINDTLLAELQAAQAARTTGWVVEWAGDRVASVKRGFREAAARAGLVGVTPHVLRHTAATWMAQEGIPMWQIAGFLGHSSVRMVEEVYSHHSPDHLEDAARALG